MELPTYFADFLAEIRPTESQNDEARRAQQVLRDRLEGSDELGPLVVSTFLQGSWRRATATRSQGDHKLDVDIVAVTKLSKEEHTPDQAMQLFVPFLEEHYSGKYRLQGRSFGIELSDISLDLVITAAPSESERGILQSESVTAPYTPEGAPDWRLVPSWVAPDSRAELNAKARMRLASKEDEWKLAPLYIPDREARRWRPTHPLEVMKWTWDKNRRCDGHYVNIVKCFKWWRHEDDPRRRQPKGYPLEHIVGVCCPDQIESVAEGVARSMGRFLERFSSHVEQGVVPGLPAHGVPAENVLARVSAAEFSAFYDRVQEAEAVARNALNLENLDESAREWKRLFGEKFPDPPADKDGRIGGFTPRKEESTVGGGRFA